MIPNNFPLEGYKQLFFDIFTKNGNLFLICPVYNGPNDISTLKIMHKDRELQLKKRISKIKVEPTEIFMYEFNSPDPRNKITVTYQGKTREYELDNLKINGNNKLALTTLFKDDFRLINVFYDYYVKQGVSKFFLYYNGVLTDEIKNLYNKPGIVLVQWNFRYWNEKGVKYSHHAQLGQMHHAIYRFGKSNCDYMIFCDLDEYMYSNGVKLINLVNNNPNVDVFGFRNRWSNTLDNTIPEKFPTKFKTSDKIVFGSRSKCLYKVSSIRTINIHFGHTFLKKDIKRVAVFSLFHFYNWCKTKRKHNTTQIIEINE